MTHYRKGQLMKEKHEQSRGGGEGGLFHPFTFQRGAENIHVITAENRVGHWQRKGRRDRWTRRKRFSYIYYEVIIFIWRGERKRERALFLVFTPMARQDRATVLCGPVLENPSCLTCTQCHCCMSYFNGSY